MSLESRDGPAGKTLYVARDEGEKGQKGPFFVVYSDDDREDRWGFFCANCETFNNAMDAMGRIQCNECANMKKADEWDAAHE
ncbi:DUF5816 domain-containing protein [Natronomonas sp. EA1]|uniref:DUF5816 domain-containing protein n=1 Tax=Natronomonas sp. EA1 TaxID=3421655 RepID=UPI003EBBE32F